MITASELSFGPDGERDGWQLIVSAPKNGRILVVSRWGTVELVRWIGEPHNIWRADSGSHATPTHWMPLPEPPKKA